MLTSIQSRKKGTLIIRSLKQPLIDHASQSVAVTRFGERSVHYSNSKRVIFS